MSSISVEAGLLQPAEVRERAWLWRILPSLSDIAFLFPIGMLFLVLDGARLLLADADTGWQIRSGEWILQHGAVPHTDFFSFSNPGGAWFAHEWLWEVGIALIHHVAGLSGVVLANSLVLSAVSVLLFRLVRRHSENDVRALAITVAAVSATAFHWLARPHLVSWVLLLIALHLIDRAQEGRVRLLWWMPVLAALWADLHGSFPVLIALLLAYGGVNTFQQIAYEGFQAFWPAVRRQQTYFVCAAIALAATLLNPYGWRLHEHIFRFLSDAKGLGMVSEYRPFNFRSDLAMRVEAFLVLGGCAGLFCFSRRRWATGVVVLIWAHLAFESARCLPIFLFLAAVPVAELVTTILKSVQGANVAKWLRELGSDLLSFGDGFEIFERTKRIPLVPIVVTFLLAGVLGALPRASENIADFDSRDFPVAAARVIAKNPDARVFTFDQWGAYLIYRLYPKMRVFVDDRIDFYGTDFSKKWVDTMEARYGWRTELESFKIDTVLLDVNAPLASVLKESRDWRSIFDDGHAIVFEKRKH